MSNFNTEQTREKYELIAKAAVAVTAVVFIAPIVFLLIKGILGLAAAIIVATGIIAIAPAISLKIANFGLQALKIEAARNPVETLQNEYKLLSKQLQKRLLAIEDSTAKYKTFEDKVETLKEKFPQEATKFEEQLVNLKLLINARREKYLEAHKNLKAFREVVEKAQAIWDVTQALAATSPSTDITAEFYSELKTKTALTAVQNSLNHSFAALDTALLEETSEKRLLL